jgi:SAM-dependent methyltransferase
MCGRAAAVTADDDGVHGNDASTEGGATPDDPRAGLPDDERALLEAFDRLAPQGTVRWHFDDVLRRLSEPDGVPGRPAGWSGLPADLWERGRSTKATERVLGDVITMLAQNLTEYTDRAVAEGHAMAAQEVDELRRAARDGLHFLSARVDRLESAADPLGLQAGELALPGFDASAWVGSAAGWAAGRTDLPAVVGELGDLDLLSAVAASGVHVEGVDPRGAVIWAGGDRPGEPGPVDLILSDVVDHLGTLSDASRGCIVLSGCVDRTDLPGKVRLVDEARRVVAPGGTLAFLVTDQSAWDAALEPVERDLLAGRPLHPESWKALLARRGLPDATWVRPADGSVHAVVVEVPR